MKEQFDKVLRDHIKDTFDAYDDGMSHNGWLSFQKKVRNKKRKIFFMWSVPSGIAASLLFFLFTNNGITEQGNRLSETSEIVLYKKNNDIASTDIETTANAEKPAVGKSSVKQTAPAKHNIIENSTSNTHVKAEEHVLAHIEPLTEQTVIFADSIKLAPIHIEHINTTASLQKDAANLILEEPTERPLFSEIFTNSNPYFSYTAQKNNKQELKMKLKNLNFALDASTFMNFSKMGLNDEINIAIGVVSEYKLSKHFSVHSGINVNRQTSSFEHPIDFSRPLDNAQNAMALTNTIGSVINGQFTNAKLVGLDIPLNIKYSSNNRKVNWFVSSGLSSYALMNEKYFNNFSVLNYGFDGVETQNLSMTEEYAKSPLSNFQFARSVNFSMGLSFPLKDVTTLSIEPFVKYPLKSLGQERLELGSGGVSMKLYLNKKLFK
ncbi:outer membrane beta-barrel protein [Pseudopedobacter beijingensis]|uniref:Outer membrane beta-barrel protein n=1 Tax=Pseudopedobacter beijingensis TaxID=1207056 RepID=A0ABW4IFL3_9SPHI